MPLEYCLLTWDLLLEKEITASSYYSFFHNMHFNNLYFNSLKSETDFVINRYAVTRYSICFNSYLNSNIVTFGFIITIKLVHHPIDSLFIW